jgi:hypothetical protein
MSATMIDMELIKADSLSVDTIEIGDLIEVDNEIVEVTFIESDSTGDNYDVEITNDFGESEVIQFAFDDEVDLYVLVE